jgi:cell division initiation protein
MRLSPADIRQQQFTVRMFRGLDPQEVDAFLEDVAEDYEATIRETALLKEQLAAHEERSRNVGDTERVLKDTLVMTQKLAEEMKAAARRDADLLVREAEMRGEKLLEAARAEEARLRSEIRQLQRTHRQLLEDLRATLERYHRFVQDEMTGGETDEPGR